MIPESRNEAFKVGMGNSEYNTGMGTGEY